MFPTTLIVLTGETTDAAVVRATIDAADRFGIRDLHVVLAPTGSSLPAALAGRGARDHAVPTAVLESAEAQLRAGLPGATVRAVLGGGDWDELVERTAEGVQADLVIGGRPVGATSRVRRLLLAASRTTLLVPADGQLTSGRAVCGLDFSAHSATALHTACQIFDTVEAVMQYDLDAAGHGGLTDDEFRLEISTNAHNHFEQDILPSMGDGSALPTLNVASGARASAVLTDAANTDTLVLGSRGLSRIASLLLGSTAEAVANQARGPVLVVRKSGESIGLLAGLVSR